MMDYAVNTCHFEINEFFDMFLVSDLAGQFAKGVPKVVSGMSGVELAMEVVRRAELMQSFLMQRLSMTVPRNTGADGLWHSISGIRVSRSVRCPRLYR